MTKLTPKNFTAVQDRMQELGLTKEVVLKEISFALQIINGSAQLSKASAESKQSAILNIAQVGLTLNPVAKLAYLVPRWDSKSRETICCLEPSYQGLVKLLTDTGSVVTINTQLVYENDLFEYTAADFDNPITHKPDPFKERGEIVGCYSIAVLPSGIKQSEVMSVKQLHEIRDYSESYKAFKADKIKSCVWTTHEGEMMRKTVLRRFVKYLPKSEQYDKVAEVINLDELDYKASDGQKTYAQELLRTSTFHEQLEVTAFENSIEMAGSEEINKIIETLKENQYDSGRMDQGDIKKKLETL